MEKEKNGKGNGKRDNKTKGKGNENKEKGKMGKMYSVRIEFKFYASSLLCSKLIFPSGKLLLPSRKLTLFPNHLLRSLEGTRNFILAIKTVPNELQMCCSALRENAGLKYVLEKWFPLQGERGRSS